MYFLFFILHRENKISRCQRLPICSELPLREAPGTGASLPNCLPEISLPLLPSTR